MIEHEIPELDRKGLREFGVTTGAMIAALFGLFFPWLFDAQYPIWPWILFGILALAGLAVPELLRPVFKAWMKLAHVLNRIMTPIVMGIVFFGVVLPMGLVMRAMGKDPMQRKLLERVESYRVQSERRERESIERPF